MKIVLRLATVATLVGATLLYTYNGIETKENSGEVRDYDDLLEGYSVSDLLKKEIDLVKANKKEMELKQLRDKLKEEELERQRIKQREEELAKLKLQQEEGEKRAERKSDVATSRGVVNPVSRSNTSMKTYMSWKAITSKSSKQYQLQQHSDIYTDEEGFRKIDDKFMIAIGTYFQAEVGQEVEVKLSSGSKFRAYVGDIKANSDTDGENLQHNTDKSIIEFLVNDKGLLPLIRKMGDCSFSKSNSFHGGVVSITVLENSIIE